MKFLEAMQAVKDSPLDVVAWPDRMAELPIYGVVYVNMCGGAQPNVGFRNYSDQGCSGEPRIGNDIFGEWTVEPINTFQKRIYDFRRQEPSE